MKIFVGYGYNQRDAWIEKDVFPILEAMGMEIVHGKDCHGEVLADAIKGRIEQADALVAFSTLRDGQQKAEFNTHVWVRDELIHGIGLRKPVVEVREKGVNATPGLLQERQTIHLDPADRLACTTELVKMIGAWSMRRLLLVPLDKRTAKQISQGLVRKDLQVRYRTRIGGRDSPWREGRIERINSGFFLGAIGLPDASFVQVEGLLKGADPLFDTGWVTADVVRIEF